MFGLNDATLTQIAAVFQTNTNIEKALVYGSRAKGNFKPWSDIDVALVGNLDLQQKWRLEEKLDDLLLPWKFDIVLYKSLRNGELKEHINRVGVVLYEQP
jgi:type I restriction enzyme S subunit